jgi:hypothetical protein
VDFRSLKDGRRHLVDRSSDEGCPRLHRSRQRDCRARLNGVAALFRDERSQRAVGSSAPGEVEDVARRSLAEPVALGEPGLRADACRGVGMCAGQDGVEQVEGDADGAGDRGLRAVG